MSETVNDILNNASIKILVAAFVLGGVFFEFREVVRDQQIIESRLEKKIKVLKDLEERVRNLEICK